MAVSETYNTDGLTLFTYPDGRKEKKPWYGVAIENRDNLYHVYKYGDGKIYFAHNCRTVDSLPNTPLVSKLLKSWEIRLGKIT